MIEKLCRFKYRDFAKWRHDKKILISGDQTTCPACNCYLKKFVILLISATQCGAVYGDLFCNGPKTFEVEKTTIFADVFIELWFHNFPL